MEGRTILYDWLIYGCKYIYLLGNEIKINYVLRTAYTEQSYIKTTAKKVEEKKTENEILIEHEPLWDCLSVWCHPFFILQNKCGNREMQEIKTNS